MGVSWRHALLRLGEGQRMVVVAVPISKRTARWLEIAEVKDTHLREWAEGNR